MTSVDKNRLDWVDQAKGLTMIIVIYLHCTTAVYAHIGLASFHMPLFFFLSGFFLFRKSRNFADYIRLKFNSLIIPYFIFGAILATYSTVLDIYRGEESMPGLRYIGLLVNARHAPFYGSLWFLLSLFCVELILFILHKNIASDVWRLIVSMLFGIAGALIMAFHQEGIIWSLDITLTCIVFTELGYLMFPFLSKYHPSLKILIAMLVACGVFAGLNYGISGMTVDLYSCRIGNIVLFYIAAILGVMSICLISKRIKMGGVIFVGKNSLLYYCLQFLLLTPVNKLLMSIGGENKVFYAISPIIATVSIILFLVPVIRFINRRLPWTIGKISVR